MGDNLGVDPKDLTDAAQGINDVMGGLKQLGFNAEAEIGRGFDGLKLSGLQIGHGDVKDAFDGFCDRWEWGVRTLVQDANSIAKMLGLNAGMYHDEEQYFSGKLKDVTVDLVGDPRTTDAQAAQMSWSQIGDQPLHAFDPETAQQRQQALAASQHNVGTAFSESPGGQLVTGKFQNPFDWGK